MSITKVPASRMVDHNIGSYCFRNKIINGDMRIDQRSAGTVYTVPNNPNSYYGSADRWLFQSSGSILSVQREVGTNINTAQALSVTGNTGNTKATIGQRIEAANTSDLAGKTVTLSFVAAANTTINAQVATTRPENIDAYDTSSAGVSIYTNNYTITTTPTTFKFTFTMPNNGYGLGVYLFFNTPLLNNQKVYFGLVQLEEGPVATPFEFRPIQTELALCQRYFCKTYDINTAPGASVGILYPDRVPGAIHGISAGGSYSAVGPFVYPVTMRATPYVQPYNTNTGAAATYNPTTTSYSNPVYVINSGASLPMTIPNIGTRSLFGWVNGVNIPLDYNYTCHFTCNAEL